MRPDDATMTPIDDLLESIFAGSDSPLYAEFARWVRDSRRFRAFAESYRTKIRAKLRSVSDEAGLLSLRGEFETAELMLRDDRFTLEYEKYAASKQRGPDFTVTYRTRLSFNIEVRRIQSVELNNGDPEAQIGKLIAVLCDKVGQMPPSIINLLWLLAEQTIPDSALIQAVTTLHKLAEAKNDDYFTRRGFSGAADFLKQYRQLSGIVLRQPRSPTIWLNPIARHKAPSEIVTTIQRLIP